MIIDACTVLIPWLSVAVQVILTILFPFVWYMEILDISGLPESWALTITEPFVTRVGTGRTEGLPSIIFDKFRGETPLMFLLCNLMVANVPGVDTPLWGDRITLKTFLMEPLMLSMIPGLK